jgi:hypothetical protein
VVLPPIEHDESHRNLLGLDLFDNKGSAGDIVVIFEMDGHLLGIVSFNGVTGAKIAGPLWNRMSGLDLRDGRIHLLWLGAMLTSADRL